MFGLGPSSTGVLEDRRSVILRASLADADADTVIFLFAIVAGRQAV